MSDTSAEQREMFGLRCAIGRQLDAHRGRYGNKDGRSKDGCWRRYDDPQWQEVERLLEEADATIFRACEVLRNGSFAPELDVLGFARSDEGGDTYSLKQSDNQHVPLRTYTGAVVIRGITYRHMSVQPKTDDEYEDEFYVRAVR